VRALVTGGSGFLGRAVAREFMRSGIEVVALVRETGTLDFDVHDTICVDLCDEVSSNEAIGARRFDIVVDAAALIMKSPNVNLRGQDYFDNVLMTRNLLRTLNDKPPAYFGKISTLDVYSLNDNHSAITEETKVAPQNHYSLSKHISELLCFRWAEDQSVPLGLMRSTQLFGPGDPSQKFIPSAIRGAREQGKIIIAGDGSDRRDYLFVDDAARMVVGCATKQVAGVVNLASGKSRSLNEVAATLQEISGRQISVEHRQRKKPKVDCAFDITNLVNALGRLELTAFFSALKQTYDSTV
jgi:UDP-glucose 4-epimerase